MGKIDHYKDKYGSWAGNNAGNKPDYNLCCQEVGRAQGRWTSFGQCAKKCGHGPGGAYCKTHDPEAVAARRAKSEADYNAKSNANRYQWYGKTFFNALQKIADGHNDARGLAQEVIEEFKKGMR